MKTKNRWNTMNKNEQAEYSKQIKTNIKESCKRGQGAVYEP